MSPSDYASAGAGKLKLKGVKDSKVDKKKKKKSSKPSKEDEGEVHVRDNSVVLKTLEDEDAKVAAENSRDEPSEAEGRTEEEKEVVKTEAERRYEEQRRRRLEDRLKREGVKTHKERVEELNRYLSSLSEHHDMPRIGPG